MYILYIIGELLNNLKYKWKTLGTHIPMIQHYCPESQVSQKYLVALNKLIFIVFNKKTDYSNHWTLAPHQFLWYKLS